MRFLIATAALLFMAPVLLHAQNVEPRYAGQGFFDFGLGTVEGWAIPFLIPGPNTYPKPACGRWAVVASGSCPRD